MVGCSHIWLVFLILYLVHLNKPTYQHHHVSRPYRDRDREREHTSTSWGTVKKSTHPPSTQKHVPVMKLALSLNRYTIASATSLGCANLPNAVVEKSSAEADPSDMAIDCLIKGVSVPPLLRLSASVV
ncbi:hypothetical protein CLCR_05256 [Cladophialophora carrionii]|uniref:Secreted protein n=1 Tax=Cladophialophora carrionii TaxID=86049 RepID=A0A1C1CLI5_9EURO|nr:hypothetical protein CLCR_05256 [Cladophialophora carrionii]